MDRINWKQVATVAAVGGVIATVTGNKDLRRICTMLTIAAWIGGQGLGGVPARR